MVDLEILDVKITLVYWRYKAMNFSLHCSIKYFKNNKCSPSILNLFFLLVRLFRRDFQRNVQHSIHTGDIAKRNSNIHFILGNTGHAWREWTVKDFQCTLIMGWCKNVACVCVYVCVCVGGGGGGREISPPRPPPLAVPTYLRDIKVDLVKVVYHHFIVSFKIHHAASLFFARVRAAVVHFLESALAQET